MSDDPGPSSAKSLFQKLFAFAAPRALSQERVGDYLQQAVDQGAIDDEALRIMQGAMQVSDMQVREIMIPSSQMAVILTDFKVEEVLKVITESAHSRFPVINAQSEEVVGILLAKDLLPLVSKVSKVSNKAANNQWDVFQVNDLLHPVVFVPESKRLNVLLKEFQTSHNHMAVVINEYGQTAGLVTIEDVLEQIVGEIEDEHDLEEDYDIKTAGPHQYVVKAGTTLESFNEYFGGQLDGLGCDTIGGVVGAHFGYLPKREEAVDIGKMRFKVLNANHRMIRLLEVTLDPKSNPL